MSGIHIARKSRHLTQEELAARLSVERSTVAKWETGRSKPRADTLIKMSKILNCSIDCLLDGQTAVNQ